MTKILGIGDTTDSWQRSLGSATLSIEIYNGEIAIAEVVGHFDFGTGDAINTEDLLDSGLKFIISSHVPGVIWHGRKIESMDLEIRRIFKGHNNILSALNCQTVMVLDGTHEEIQSGMRTICRQADTLEEALEILQEARGKNSTVPRPLADREPTTPIPFIGTTPPLWWSRDLFLGPSFGTTLIGLVALLLGTKGSWGIATSFLAGGGFFALLQFAGRLIRK